MQGIVIEISALIKKHREKPLFTTFLALNLQVYILINQRRSQVNKLNITICGCGNGSHACAALLSRQGHNVNIYSPIEKEIELFKENYTKSQGLTIKMGSGIMEGLNSENENLKDVEVSRNLKINKISDKASEVIPESSLIFIITPSFAHKNILYNIRDYVSKDSILVFMPSRGGLEYEATAIIPHANVVAFQTLPWACRIKNFGSEIYISGRKSRIQAASLPGDISPIYFYLLEKLLELKIERIEHITTLTLANVGQIFHPGIMYGTFKDNPKVTFEEDNIPMFYQGISEEIAQLLSDISCEIQNIAKKLNETNENIEHEKVFHVKDWLLSSYEELIEDKSSLHKMITTNSAYKGIKVPVRKVDENLYAPDFGSRYVVEDVPYGLLVSKSIAMMVNIETPVIDEVIDSLGKWTGNDYMGNLKSLLKFASQSRIPQFYGVNNINDYIKY